jgi:diaminopimelate decarboxylase
MPGFNYINGQLCCNKVSLAEIAGKVGTPFYVYSRELLEKKYDNYEQAFSSMPHLICFAFKANSNPTICNILARKGAGADVVSGGELEIALRVGVPADKIVFAGVAKTDMEIGFALEKNIKMFNVESLAEAERIDAVAGMAGKKARVALRINPDVELKTHDYIATGRKATKFGIDIEIAREVFEKVAAMPNVEIVGIHAHIGSQLLDTKPFADSAQRLKDLMVDLKDKGITFKSINIGGGLGINYNDEDPDIAITSLAEAVCPVVSNLGYELIIEPGRSIVGPTGVLVTRVSYTKQSGGKNFAIVDSAMNDLLRPSLYMAFHNIKTLKEVPDNSEKILYDVVGPVCETGDFFAKDRALPRLNRGDMIALKDAGAYGYTMSSNYNTRPRSAEVLVNSGSYKIIRERETIDDMLSKAVFDF